MKLERSNIEHPVWRKKVDASLFQYSGTTIPNWACEMWNIDSNFANVTSKKNPLSKVVIVYDKQEYCGWITVAIKGRKSPAFRLWFDDELQYALKEIYLMSFMRDIESRLRTNGKTQIEDEIPFWEFLDIEFDSNNRKFLFTAYYTHKPLFPQLFRRLIGSPMMHRIDDELKDKPSFRIYKQDWRPREQLTFELEVDNALYTLADTKNKLLYVGEAKNLVKRLMGAHPSIKDWDYYRYDVLPRQMGKEHRKTLERMMIRYLACLIPNNAEINNIKISDYKLANDRIDYKY